MFLVSGPDLVVETCRAGLIGTFPALNQRTSEGFAAWCDEISGRLAAAETGAVWGVNLIVHKTNPRLAEDLAICAAKRVPLVITSLGAVPDIVRTIQAYGGIVCHDVISRRHAEKAAAAGVDGIIAVCAGAGGHAGTINPFALLSEIRAVFDGLLILSGAMNTGRDIAAARVMGADLAYLGTRFIATKESLCSDAQKQMQIAAQAADIVSSAAITGVSANFMRQSLESAGIDPTQLHTPLETPLNIADEARAWKTIWSAGHGVGGILDLPAAADLCRDLAQGYRAAVAAMRLDPFAQGV